MEAASMPLFPRGKTKRIEKMSYYRLGLSASFF
jgi:hypothetical protein